MPQARRLGSGNGGQAKSAEDPQSAGGTSRASLPRNTKTAFFPQALHRAKNLEAAPLWQIWLSAGGSPAWKPPPQQQHLERKCMPIAAALGIAEGRLWPPLLREPQEQLEAEDHQRASLYPTCSRPRHVLQALRPTLQTWG